MQGVVDILFVDRLFVGRHVEDEDEDGGEDGKTAQIHFFIALDDQQMFLVGFCVSNLLSSQS